MPQTLVIAEVSIAFLLLIKAGLLFLSMGHLPRSIPAMPPSNLLTMQVQESGHRLNSADPVSALRAE